MHANKMIRNVFSLLSFASTAYSSLDLRRDVSTLSVIDVGTSLQTILGEAFQGIYSYPTSLTQDIVPKGIHSHNDYWRDVPVYSALSVGAISIEADVWFFNDTLYVGHEPSSLSPNRTLDSLYIQPILDIINRQNPRSAFLNDQLLSLDPGAPIGKNGVFDTSIGQTLYLFVDVKTDGLTTFPAVIKALQPLRDAGYLSNVTNGTTFKSGPVTVMGTGNTPLSLVQPVLNRDFFFDATIAELNSTQSNITSLVSPIASDDFGAVFGTIRGTELTGSNLDLLRTQVAGAHAKGIAVRYWDQPGWPTSTRDGLWRQLWTEGVDLINVDDLPGIFNF